MDSTSRTLVVLCCLLAGNKLMAQSRPATQPAEERLLWDHSYVQREHPRARRIHPLDPKGYRIVGETSWTKDKNAPLNDRYGFEFFLLDVDQHGHQRSVATFEKTPRHREQIWDSIPSGNDLFVTGERNWFERINPQQELQNTGQRQKPSSGSANPRCLVAREKGRFLIAGSLSFKDAWVAEVDSEGRTIWERTFDHGADECVYAIVNRPDGGFVLAANSGKYNKFGQGPSRIWLIACDAEGNKRSEATLPDARLQPFGTPILASSGDGCLLVFSRTQLPPINQVQVCSPLAFDWHIASFDRELKLTREMNVRPTRSMSNLLVVRSNGGCVSIGAVAEGLSLVDISPDGKSQRETVIPLSGILHPVDVVPQHGTLTILMNCTVVHSEPNTSSENVIRLVQLRE